MRVAVYSVYRGPIGSLKCENTLYVLMSAVKAIMVEQDAIGLLAESEDFEDALQKAETAMDTFEFIELIRDNKTVNHIGEDETLINHTLHTDDTVAFWYKGAHLEKVEKIFVSVL